MLSASKNSLPAAPAATRNWRAWAGPSLLKLVVITMVLTHVGCRTLRARRQTQELSSARQNSLRGAEKLQQNKLQEAEFLFTEALRHSSADERAQSGMAEVLWQQGEKSKAIQHMTQAATISGENPDYLVRLGEMKLQQGDYDQALVQANLALDSQRRHAGAWALRGQVLQKRNQLEEAMSCYHRALGDQPNSPQVQLALAEIYRSLGRPQRALATLDCMTDGQSAEQVSAQAWLLKGQALADLGEHGAARTCMKNAAFCVADDQTDMLLALAESQIEAGDMSEARICLGRACRHDPHNPLAQQLQLVLDQANRRSSPPVNLTGFEQAVPDAQ